MARITHTDILVEESYTDVDGKHHSYKVRKRTEEETHRLEQLVRQLEGQALL